MNASFANAIDVLRAAGRGDAGWSEAARLAAAAVGADAAAIVVWRLPGHEVESEEGHGFDPALVREYGQHYFRYDVMLQTHPPDAQWQVSDERFPDAQWSRNPFFGDLLPRHRVRQIIALTLRGGDDVIAALSIHRSSRRPIVADDFRRGALHRLTIEATRAFRQRYDGALAAQRSLHELLDEPARCCFVADATGRVLPLGPDAPLREPPPPLAFRDRRWHCADGPSARRIAALIAAATAGRRGTTVVRWHDAVWRIEALPLPGRTGLTHVPARALLQVLPDRGRQSLPEAGVLQEIFEVTAAQARVLHLLCEGFNTKQCADRLQRSEATVRSHIAALLHQLGCARQSQLVQAVLRLGA